MGKQKVTASGFLKFLGRMLLWAAIGALIVTGIERLWPRYYTCSAVLLFPGAKSSAGGEQMGGMPGAGGSSDQPSLPLMQGALSVPQPGTSPSTAALILNSRRVTVHLLEKFRLQQEWHLPLEKSIERFHERFLCYEGGSGDLRVAFTDRNPKRSQEVVDTSRHLLTQSIEEFSLAPAARNVEFLRDSLKKAETNCARIQTDLIRLQREVGGTSPDTQTTTWGQILGEIEKELATAQVQSAVAETSMKATTEVTRKILRAAQDPSSGAGGSLLSNLYREVTQKETDLALLREKFTDRRPEVVQARQALEAARRSLNAEIARQVDSVQEGGSPLTREALVNVVASRTRVDGLRESVKTIRAKLQGLPIAQARFTQLSTDLRDERARVSLLRSEHLRAELIARSRAPQFVVLDPPTIPRRPNGWDSIYFTLAGAITGAVLLCLWAAISSIRRSVRDMKM